MSITDEEITIAPLDGVNVDFFKCNHRIFCVTQYLATPICGSQTIGNVQYMLYSQYVCTYTIVYRTLIYQIQNVSKFGITVL